MALRNRTQAKEREKTAAEYYELKTDAVNELINANVTNTKEVSSRELRKFRSKSLRNLSENLKYFVLKWWFAGVVCWFFLIGLGSYGISTPDMVLIMGIVTGLLWDLPVNIFIRLKAEKKDYDRFMMFPKTGVAAGILNAVYGVVLMVLTALVYTGVNAAIQPAGGNLAVGPILFGFFTAGWDWILLKAKMLAGRIIADAKKQASVQTGRSAANKKS